MSDHDQQAEQSLNINAHLARWDPFEPLREVVRLIATELHALDRKLTHVLRAVEALQAEGKAATAAAVAPIEAPAPVTALAAPAVVAGARGAEAAGDDQQEEAEAPDLPAAEVKPARRGVMRTARRERLLRQLWAKPMKEISGRGMAAELSELPGAPIFVNGVNVWAYDLGLPYRDPEHRDFGKPRKARVASLLPEFAATGEAEPAPALQGDGQVAAPAPDAMPDALPAAEVAPAVEAAAPAPAVVAPAPAAVAAPAPSAAARPAAVAPAPAVAAPAAAPVPPVPSRPAATAVSAARPGAALPKAPVAGRMPAVSTNDIYRPMSLEAARRWGAERGMPREADVDQWVAAKSVALGLTRIKVVRG